MSDALVMALQEEKAVAPDIPKSLEVLALTVTVVFEGVVAV